MADQRNLLSTETSPYLRQHKDNPVWWHPWGDAAFERARAEDKPVFLSIGYSTCYWCHVMEHDSFEREEVARVLNENFISIKVDREELPDVDQIYMDVVIGIHGHGGWPMSVFLTPDREPFWGGTFFYRVNFINILQAMSDAWKNDREKVTRSSAELTRYLEARKPKLAEAPIDVNVLGLALHQLFKRYDREFGGFGQAPKFPPTQSLAFLLRAHALRPNAAALEAFTTTLSGMARGGFFDQLGGGFHRYSVDAEWKIPHFEKMLYDNALLAPIYLDGYRATGNGLFRTVAERTLDYMVREMSAPEGGFFSAEDAGEVDREGEYYSWTQEEVMAALPPAMAQWFCAVYSVTLEGNFEHGRSALVIPSDEAWRESESPELREARQLLLTARAKRPRPHRDDKILTGWNGLAITALCRGYQVLGREDLLEAAVKAATFIERALVIDGRLQRRYCAGQAGIPALLEDYAYLIEGYRALFESTGDATWIERAAALQREQDKYLWSGERRAYVSSAAPGLIVQMVEWVDGAAPSPNGISLANLLVLAEVTGDPAFAYRAQLLEQGLPSEVSSLPMVYMATLNSVLLRMAGAASCSVVVPTPADTPPAEVRELWTRFLPFVTVVWGRSGGKGAKMLESRAALGDKATLYVCRHAACQEPTVDVERAVRLCSTTSITFGE
jgi:uncharacterized protein YyaL (SSP411 family)